MARLSSFLSRWACAPPLLLLTLHAAGQSSIASYNGVHAIVGARIEVGDGRTIEKGTVVIKDGLIVAVSADAAVPRGAEVLDGKGLTVYPGFIDAYSTKGYTAPAAPKSTVTDPNGDIANYASAFMRETVRTGIHPEARVTAGLALAEDQLKGYQSSGFTTALVAPTGGDMPGLTALVNLSGRSLRECVVLPMACEAFSFGGNSWGDSYPSSLMGHIAQLRQTLFDAQWYAQVRRCFDAGASKRPPMDESLDALQPVVNGRIPVAFDADSSLQIGRAIDMSAEFGMKLLIAGGKEGWKRIDDLKRTGTPVLLSLAFDKEPGAKPEGNEPKGGDAPAKSEEPENPVKVAERKRLYDERLKNAAALSAAGIPFALTTKGNPTPTAFMENLRKAVKAGLTKEAALRALTIDAAKIFGVDRQLGTIEAGKTANITVLSSDFLDPKTKVKMLYIDGRKIDPDAPKATPTFRFQFKGEGGN